MKEGVLCECGNVLSKNGKKSIYRGDIKVNEKQQYRCNSCGRNYLGEPVTQPKEFIDDKKVGVFNWREWNKHLIERQELHQKASFSQDNSNIEIPTDKEKIIIQPVSDIHIGSIGTDYRHLLDFTDGVLTQDNLFLILVGDLVDGFVQFRNMLAVHQQILSPEEQDSFLESWIQEIKHKILFATWDNHSEFEEKATGKNIVKKILNRNLVYFNGIAQANIKAGEVSYKLALTHKTRYNSSFNKTHGLKQLARKDLPLQDIYIAGDIHDPSFDYNFEQGMWQLHIRLGTFKVNDGYSKRYFAYHTSMAMPCFVLNTKTKEITPFLTLKQAMDFCK